MGIVSETHARGLARALGREMEEAGAEARRRGFLFALRLVGVNERGRRIDGPGFNVPLAEVVREAGGNAATLRVEFERLRLGRPGVYHRQSAHRVDVLHFRGGGREFAEREWAVAVDLVRVERGALSMRFWTPETLFSHHLVERWLNRGGAGRAERATALLDAALPLAALYRACAWCPEGDRFHALDVVSPAPGGVVCGGTELVSCPAVGQRFANAVVGGEHCVQSLTAPSTLHMTASFRTYVDDARLGRGQRRAAAEVARWAEAHREALRRDRLGTYGWSDTEAAHEVDPALVESFRPVCAEVQEHFSSWKRTLHEEGYADIDFRSLLARFAVEPPPEGAAMDPRLLAEHMHVSLRDAG